MRGQGSSKRTETKAEVCPGSLVVMVVERLGTIEAPVDFLTLDTTEMRAWPVLMVPEVVANPPHPVASVGPVGSDQARAGGLSGFLPAGPTRPVGRARPRGDVPSDSAVLHAQTSVRYRKRRDSPEILHPSLASVTHWTCSSQHGWVYRSTFHLAIAVPRAAPCLLQRRRQRRAPAAVSLGMPSGADAL